MSDDQKTEVLGIMFILDVLSVAVDAVKWAKHEGGGWTGSPNPPLEKSQNIGFSNSRSRSPKNRKATKPA